MFDFGPVLKILTAVISQLANNDRKIRKLVNIPSTLVNISELKLILE